MTKKLCWLMTYAMVFCTLMFIRHFGNFEQAVIIGLAWAVAAISTSNL